MSIRFLTGPALLALAAFGCSSPKSAVTPLVFNRPEHVGFVCLDPDHLKHLLPGASEDDPRPPLVLPLRCCAASAPLSPSDSLYAADRDYKFDNCGVDKYARDSDTVVTPTLHALVTQSTRGEVASVNMAKNKVIDSDPVVPGYTYVDVGGIPSAIVVPPGKLTTKGDALEPNEDVGPTFAYVAIAEELFVRAVDTCRFSGSGDCPDKLSDSAFDKVPVAAPPKDMVLGPDGALWLTFPDLGAIGRIELTDRDDRPFAQANADDEPPVQPVAEYFAIESIGDAVPSEATPEATNYRGGCGLGYNLSAAPASIVAPPSAPFVSLDGPQPSRLRYDPVSKLLLVGDRSEGAVRAYDVSSKVPVPRGTVLTGGPVRDFALTPAVPEQIFGSAAADQTLPKRQVTLPADGVRYLYAIDDREGNVLVQRFTYDEPTGLVSGTPLQTPYTFRFNDRIGFGTSSALALEVIDTRDLSIPACGVPFDEYVLNGEVQRVPNRATTTLESLDALSDRVDPLEDDCSDAKKKVTSKLSDTAWKSAVDARNLKCDEYTRAALQEALYQGASPTQLRGVFLAVTTAEGSMRIFDVFDLDLYCKADNSCAADDPRELTGESYDAPIAVQRHAQRLLISTSTSVSYDDDENFGAIDDGCGAGFHDIDEKEGKDGDVYLCAPDEPWMTQSTQWNLSYEGVLPALNSEYGYLVDDGEEVRLVGGPGLNFCERGISPKDRMNGPGVAGEVTDVLAVTSSPGDDAPTTCPDVDPANPQLLKIAEAHADYLVLADYAEASALAKCYPDLIGFALRVQGEFVMSSASLTLFGTTRAGATGECETDPTVDPGLSFRVVPGKKYDGKYLKFQLKDAEYTRGDIQTIVYTNAVSPVAPGLTSSATSRTDALPVTIRYFPYTGDVYVVDSASQGLLRYGLAPLGTLSTGVR